MPLMSEARTCNNGLKKGTTQGKVTKGFHRNDLSIAKIAQMAEIITEDEARC